MVLLLTNLILAIAGERSAGILYEIWHSEAAAAMAQVKSHGLPQLTTEAVIRSDGNHTLTDVFPLVPNVSWYSGDIYNVEPAELGFYCLYKARDEASCNKTIPPTPYYPPPVPDCPMATAVATRHAALLHGAGFDYVALDITNWPQVNAATDVAVLRPLEILMDEWLVLRASGIPTPFVAPWCNSPIAAYEDGHMTTWQWLLDHVYNNASRAPLVWRGKNGGGAGAKKMTFFVPDNGFNNDTVNALIASNSGKDDIEVIKMWAMMGKRQFDNGTWGFFSACTDPLTGGQTTSMVGVGACTSSFVVSSS